MISAEQEKMMRQDAGYYRLLDTPTGPFAIAQPLGDGSLCTFWVDEGSEQRLRSMKHDPHLADEIARRVMRYFDGESVDFSDVVTPSGSAFHRSCWEACRQIPRGQTISYADLADRAGSRPGAARAAGQAMRHNRLPIIIPCHRVIASNGSLGGFSGSADVNGTQLSQKRYLLELEQALVPSLC